MYSQMSLGYMILYVYSFNMSFLLQDVSELLICKCYYNSPRRRHGLFAFLKFGHRIPFFQGILGYYCSMEQSLGSIPMDCLPLFELESGLSRHSQEQFFCNC